MVGEASRKFKPRAAAALSRLGLSGCVSPRWLSLELTQYRDRLPSPKSRNYWTDLTRLGVGSFCT